MVFRGAGLLRCHPSLPGNRGKVVQCLLCQFFFTSYPLLEYLYSKKNSSMWKLLDRDEKNSLQFFFLKKMQSKTMKRGETVWRMKGPILALTWIDNKPVTIFWHNNWHSWRATTWSAKKEKRWHPWECCLSSHYFSLQLLHGWSWQKRSNEVLLWH